MLLKRGSQDEYVVFLQYGLHILCFMTYGFDGIFGYNTEVAIKDFQKTYGLDVDGIVGDKTWRVLEEEIELIQRALKDKGIDIGIADGIAGSSTYNGVIRFQKNEGLVADGMVGKDTRKELFNSDNVPEKPSKPNGVKIFIDPGHGGSDPGAIGNNLREKDLTLEISLMLKDILVKAGYDVSLSRENDVYVSLEERARMANNLNSDLFISIHCNSFSNASANGTECFVHPNGRSEGKEFGKAVVKEMASKLSLTDRGLKTANFAVLRLTKMLAVLVETAFISSYSDAGKLKSRTIEFAEAIAKVVKDKY